MECCALNLSKLAPAARKRATEIYSEFPARRGGVAELYTVTTVYCIRRIFSQCPHEFCEISDAVPHASHTLSARVQNTHTHTRRTRGCGGQAPQGCCVSLYLRVNISPPACLT